MAGAQALTQPLSRRYTASAPSNGSSGCGSSDGNNTNGSVCDSAHAAVKANLLLKGRPFLRLGVVEAAYIDVGRVGKAIVAPQVQGRVGPKVRQGILALHPAIPQEASVPRRQ